MCGWLSNLFVEWNTVGQIFDALWPDIPKPIVHWTDNTQHQDEDAMGYTLIPSDDSNIIVAIDINITLYNSIEILAHELAHVACHHKYGNVKSHGSKWKQCFNAIYDEYSQRIQKLNEEIQ